MEGSAARLMSGGVTDDAAVRDEKRANCRHPPNRARTAADLVTLLNTLGAKADDRPPPPPDVVSGGPDQLAVLIIGITAAGLVVGRGRPGGYPNQPSRR